MKNKLYYRLYGRVMELVDIGDLKSPGHCVREGSTPSLTIFIGEYYDL